jgi:predicted nuclease with TOPRIM domain
MGLQGYDHMLEKVEKAQEEITKITSELRKVQAEITQLDMKIKRIDDEKRRIGEERRKKVSECDSLKKKMNREYELLQVMKGGTRQFLRQLRGAFAKR